MEIIDLSLTERSILNRYIRQIRDIEVQKDSMRFRRNIERIGEIMAYNISKKLDFEATVVKTPFDNIEQYDVKKGIVLGAILRASLPMHQGLLNYFDDAENAIISAFRRYTNETDFIIEVDYMATPSLDGKVLILADPMLATGESLSAVYHKLIEKAGRPSEIHIVSAVASQQGIDYLKNCIKDDNVTVWCAVIDPSLNSHNYIVPGLGDAGDLAYGGKL